MPIVSRGVIHKRAFASDHRCEQQLRDLATFYQTKLGLRLDPTVILRRAVMLLTNEVRRLDRVDTTGQGETMSERLTIEDAKRAQGAPPAFVGASQAVMSGPRETVMAPERAAADAVSLRGAGEPACQRDAS